MTAIVGGSGSGKTTLLNFLAGRTQKNSGLRGSGEFYLNNIQVPGLHEFRNIIGFVA